MSNFITHVELGFKHVLDFNGYDHILFLMSLYFKKKNDKKKIIFLLTKINSFKFFFKIFFLLVTPNYLVNKLRS